MKFFSVDNAVWRAISRLGEIWVLDLIWLLCCLPVITIGASTTALVYSCMKLQQDEGHLFGNFFKSFKENFVQATGIWLIYAAIGALLAGNLIFWNQMDSSGVKIMWILTIALLIPYFGSLVYVFAIQAKFIHTVPQTIHYAVVMAIKHWVTTIQMVCILGIVLYLIFFTINLALYATLFFGAGVIAYIFAKYQMTVFEHYLPKPKPEWEEETETDTENN